MLNECMILIVDHDSYFREELYNFLLSASYLCLDTADNYGKALDKIRRKPPNVVLLDSEGCLNKKKIKSIAKINSAVRVIFMITAEDQQKWIKDDNNDELEFLIKNTFAQNLLYMLNNRIDKQKFN